MKHILQVILVGIVTVAWCCTSFANVDQLKAYRGVYPDYKPKCIYCHTDEKPKKDEGAHELNAYGKKVVEIADEKGAGHGDEANLETYGAIYKELGTHEAFVAQEAPSAEDAK